jgi:hypothetical protein
LWKRRSRHVQSRLFSSIGCKERPLACYQEELRWEVSLQTHPAQDSGQVKRLWKLCKMLNWKYNKNQLVKWGFSLPQATIAASLPRWSPTLPTASVRIVHSSPILCSRSGQHVARHVRIAALVKA